ncbi:MAG: ACT domain-containing protein, partial [Kiritimatiellae bacterium]|nr:ACT domain-containing protein [Kiritimatiellia bacterium]
HLRKAGDVRSRFYVRFTVLDKAGSLGTMATILGRHNVSVSAATQKPIDKESTAYTPVVMLTHPAAASDLDAALKEIYDSGILAEHPVKLRML